VRTPQGQDAREEEGGGVSRSGGAGGGGEGAGGAAEGALFSTVAGEGVPDSVIVKIGIFGLPGVCESIILFFIFYFYSGRRCSRLCGSKNRHFRPAGCV
jgi:hypothetical protein